MPLTLEIVTPEARVFSDTVETVVIPTVQGEIGILPGHIPLLAQVESGELRVTKGRPYHTLAVGTGFVQVEGDLVSVLAEHAIREEQNRRDGGRAGDRPRRGSLEAQGRPRAIRNRSP